MDEMTARMVEIAIRIGHRRRAHCKGGCRAYVHTVTAQLQMSTRNPRAQLTGLIDAKVWGNAGKLGASAMWVEQLGACHVVPHRTVGHDHHKESFRHRWQCWKVKA